VGYLGGKRKGREARGEERWQRKVVEWERMRIRDWKEEEEGSDLILLNFDLSKERNSMDMKNSNQLIQL
jgi:hypothetical protein